MRPTLQSFQHLEPPDGMHLDDTELLCGQLARLVEELLGDAHLAEIVEVGAESEGGELSRIEPERAPDRQPVLRHPPAVSVGIAVGRLERPERQQVRSSSAAWYGPPRRPAPLGAI